MNCRTLLYASLIIRFSNDSFIQHVKNQTLVLSNLEKEILQNQVACIHVHVHVNMFI